MVVSMNEDYELWAVNGREEWEKLGIEFLQLPISDMFQSLNQNTLKKGVEFICSSISQLDNNENGHKPSPSVYVHCRAGKTRSATLVACYLMKRYGWNPEQAVQHIRNKRPQILLYSQQWKALRDFHKEL